MKKPKRFTLEFKKKAVERLISGEKHLPLCKKIGINPSTIYYWKKQLADPPTSGRGKHPEASKANGHARDAIIYLRHARTAMIRQVVEEKDKLENPVYMFALMALNALEGRS